MVQGASPPARAGVKHRTRERVTCHQAVHVTLREAGIPFQLEKVDLENKRTEHGHDFRDINPKGSVPALQPEMTTLTALLFRGVRFTPGKVIRKPYVACWNCRKRLEKHDPAMVGRSNKIHYLHPACAKAIAEDGNEHTRETTK